MNLPRTMLFQWHITERCNARCSHCYQSSNCIDRPESDIAELKAILQEIERFMQEHRRHAHHRSSANLTITGGEPFVHSDFPRFLSMLRESADQYPFSIGILSNGLSIDKGVARLLHSLKVRFVQVSIEGKPETHDSIRGAGAHAKAIKGLKHLIEQGITTYVAFTAHRANFRDLPAVVEQARRLGVSRVWVDRLIPLGQGGSLADSLLNPAETRELILQLAQLRAQNRRGKTEVAMHRALQFAANGSRPYFCKAGWSLLTILPGGKLVPCRRMPIPVGDLLVEGLWELYRDSEVLAELRDPKRISQGCESCFFSRLCRGGLRCLSHALYGTPWIADPGCWLASRKGEVPLSTKSHGRSRTESTCWPKVTSGMSKPKRRNEVGI